MEKELKSKTDHHRRPGSSLRSVKTERKKDEESLWRAKLKMDTASAL